MFKKYVVILAFLTKIGIAHAMEISAHNLHTLVKELHGKATLMYEQAFLCELLSSIMQSRAADEFRADVLNARNKIYGMTLKSLTAEALKFDAATTSDEKLAISKIYYTLRYLVRQKAYKQLQLDYCMHRDQHTLPFLGAILPLLQTFARSKRQSPQKALIGQLYLDMRTLENILSSYQSECPRLRGEYNQAVTALRENILMVPQCLKHLFHKYLTGPAKILPLLLNNDAATEPSSESPCYIPIYNFSTDADLQAQEDSPDNCCSPSHGYRPIQHDISNLSSIMFLYDFLEYWTSRINAVLQDREGLIAQAPLFVQSYQANIGSIQDACEQLARTSGTDNTCATTIELCTSLRDSLTGIQDHHDNAHACSAFLTEKVAKYLANRY